MFLCFRKKKIDNTKINNPKVNTRAVSGGTSITVNPVNTRIELRPQKEAIPKHIRNSVWNNYHHGTDTGICYCCGLSIYRYNKGWHCAHVIAEAKGGVIAVDNLRPSCAHCNLSMGDLNLYVYIKQKQLRGPGCKNVNTYLKAHPDQILDKRTNNWRKTTPRN